MRHSHGRTSAATRRRQAPVNLIIAFRAGRPRTCWSSWSPVLVTGSLALLSDARRAHGHRRPRPGDGAGRGHPGPARGAGAGGPAAPTGSGSWPRWPTGLLCSVSPGTSLYRGVAVIALTCLGCRWLSPRGGPDREPGQPPLGRVEGGLAKGAYLEVFADMLGSVAGSSWPPVIIFTTGWRYTGPVVIGAGINLLKKCPAADVGP